jgi:hypothetical protein
MADRHAIHTIQGARVLDRYGISGYIIYNLRANVYSEAPRVHFPRELITGDPNECWGVVSINSQEDIDNMTTRIIESAANARYHRAELRRQ